MIQVQGLKKSYGGYQALDDLSFEVPRGAYLVIIGPNGAGKSALMKLTMGLLTPDAGTIALGGVHPQRLPRGAVGYVPQIKAINRKFPASAEELVLSGLLGYWPFFGKKAAFIKAHQALDEVGALHLLGKPLSGLSGGELQRVYLARAFARRPKYLILDEPATGIDAVGEKDMYQLIEIGRETFGATVVMVSHDMETARYHASHVLLLNRKMVSFGPPEVVLTQHNLDLAFGHAHHTHACLPREQHRIKVKLPEREPK